MVRKLLAAFVGLAVFGMVTAASAAPITRTYVFNASNFGGGALVDPVIGTVVLTFDPAIAQANTAADASSIVNFGVLGNLTGSQIGFDYNPVGEVFTVGGINFDGDADQLAGAPNFPDFVLGFSGVNNPTGPFFQFTNDNVGTSFIAEEVSIAQVPEPSTLAIFVMALLGLAILAWRRREPVLVRQAA